MKSPPPSIRKIIEAMSGLAAARCAQHGVSDEVFHRAFLRAKDTPPRPRSLCELFDRAYRLVGIEPHPKRD